MAIFFDLDHTLLRKSSGEIYGRYLFKQGILTVRDLVRIGGWALAHRLNALDLDGLVEKSMTWIKGRQESWLKESCRTCVFTQLPAFFYPKALKLVAEHCRTKEPVYLLSASSRYIADPIVDYLGLNGALATELDVADGVFTGKVKVPFCYGEGKLAHLQAFCRTNDIALSDCTYYGDSYSDVYVLRSVGRAIAVNPDFRLRKEARKEGWRVLTF